VTLTERSPLPGVAIVVGDALRRHGVRAVLTGGACASLHTGGRYISRDMDFIVVGGATQDRLDRAMASVGFRRRGDRYLHPRVRFYAEFPRGPLAIGRDHQVKPVQRRTRYGRALVLSATDSCRDRLAAFYHWGDRESLGIAVAIALHARVHMDSVRRWSIGEGLPDRFEAFRRELRRARTSRRTGRGGRARRPVA
jgi:hypothetical protein